MKRIMVCLAMLALGCVAPRMAVAECCDHCGCQCQCCKVCRLVPDVKKVPKVTYACECEDICIPGPSCIVGYQCQADDDCDCGHHRHPEPIWQPSCDRIITRHKLVKIETVKEVKTFKCVVVNLCPHCHAQNGAPEKAAANVAANQPATPSADDASDALPELAGYEAGAKDVKMASSETESPSIVDRLKRSFQPILGK